MSFTAARHSVGSRHQLPVVTHGYRSAHAVQPASRQITLRRRARHLAARLAAAAGEQQPFGNRGHLLNLKQALLQAVSRSNNPQPGDSPPELERAVEAAAEALAAANPTPGPAASPLLNGSWALLYSGRSRRLAAGAAFPASSGAAPSLREALQAASDAAYSAFYRYVPVLAGSAVGRARGSSASNVQVLRPGRVDNIVTTKGPLPLRLCVSGSVETVPPAGGAAATCVAVRFDAFTARLGGLPEAAVSLGWLRPLGYVDTLYLDEELRVSVGDKGGLFVLRRVAGHGAGAEAAAAPEPPAAAGR